MANVVIFTSGKTPLYLQSVNTPDYSSNPDAIINPDLSNVSGVPLKYWKRIGDAVVEMSASEKQAVDAVELQKRKNQADAFEIPISLIIEGLITAGNNQWSKGNTITKQQVIDWLKNNIT